MLMHVPRRPAKFITKLDISILGEAVHSFSWDDDEVIKTGRARYFKGKLDPKWCQARATAGLYSLLPLHTVLCYKFAIQYVLLNSFPIAKRAVATNNCAFIFPGLSVVQRWILVAWRPTKRVGRRGGGVHSDHHRLQEEGESAFSAVLDITEFQSKIHAPVQCHNFSKQT